MLSLGEPALKKAKKSKKKKKKKKRLNSKVSTKKSITTLHPSLFLLIS
jgi:hypothetical protein